MDNKYSIIIPIEGVLVAPFVDKAVDSVSRNMSWFRGMVTRATYKMGMEFPFKQGADAIKTALKFGAYKGMVVDARHGDEFDAVRALIREHDVTLFLGAAYDYATPVFERMYDVVGDGARMVALPGRKMGGRDIKFVSWNADSKIWHPIKDVIWNDPAHTWMVTSDCKTADATARQGIRTAHIDTIAPMRGPNIYPYDSLADFVRENTVRGMGR